jgi:hypothetical protein
MMEISNQSTMKSSRCCMDGCKKKLQLTSFPCRCGNSYCPIHRSDVVHNCAYDYKKQQQVYLSSVMEKVVATRVDII